VRRRAAAAAAAILAAAVTGCGTQALTTPVLRDRAADACQAATRLETKIPLPAHPSGTLGFLRRGILVLDREYTQLRRLDAGGKAAPVFHRALVGLEDELASMGTAAAELSHGGDPLSTFKALQTRLSPLEQSENSTWVALEIPACASA
jgi:hypothetical protein